MAANGPLTLTQTFTTTHNCFRYPETAAHDPLVLTREVILKGPYKLMTAERGNTRQFPDLFENQWQHPNGSWCVAPPLFVNCHGLCFVVFCSVLLAFLLVFYVLPLS